MSLFNGEKLDKIFDVACEIRDLLKEQKREFAISTEKDIFKISDTLKTIQVDLEAIKMKTLFHKPIQKEAV